MTHHIIPGSQIDASQALPHKTHAQHQESAHAEILDHGPGMAVQGAAIDGNGRGMAGRAMVGTTVDDMQAQLTVHDIMASMPAPAAARTSVDNVQDVLAALDHLEVVRMAAAGVERRRAAPAQAEGDATGRCRAQGGDTSDGEAWQIADFPTRLATTTQASTAQAEPVAWMDPTAGCVMDAFLWQKDAANPQYSQPVFATPVTATSSTDAQAAAEVRDEAARLAPILRGMCEGGGPEEGVDIYADDYQAADGDVFVVRAAELLEEFAAIRSAGDTGEQADGGAA